MKPNNPNSIEDLSIEFHSHSGDRKKNGPRRCNTNLWVYWRVFVQPSLRSVAIRRSLLPNYGIVGDIEIQPSDLLGVEVLGFTQILVTPRETASGDAM